MDRHKLVQALDKLYAEESARIVFWNDPGGEFESTLADLQLDDIELVRLDQVSSLQLKIRLEREQPAQKFLLYAPSEPPAEAEDWLLDIRLYSRSFRADRASIILDQIGLAARQALRAHIAERRLFFDSQERTGKLRERVHESDDELDLDRKMLAILARAEQDDFLTIVRALYADMVEPEDAEPEPDLDAAPKAWKSMDRFGLIEPFWRLVAQHFGYAAENPSLKSLLLRLMVSDFLRGLKADPPAALADLRLPATGAANAAVFLARWRDSARFGVSHDRLAAAAEITLDIKSHVAGLEPETLLDVMTFPCVERAVLRSLLQRVRTTRETIDPAAIHELANRRIAGHWVASPSIPAAERDALVAFYRGLAVAAEFFQLHNQHRVAGFVHHGSAEALYRSYESELYRFDQLYRHFCVHADVVERRASDVLKSLRADIEDVYSNWYLTELSLAWGHFVDASLLRSWRLDLDDVRNQHEFYQWYIQPTQDSPGKRRSYVIISDALRYEVAEELTTALNGEYRVQAELGSQLGVLPSYTALGMASLLPHETLSYDRKGAVLVDGKRSASTQQRSAILATRQGVAIKAEDLLAMKKEQGRAFQEEHRVLYIYHNEIDARGDTASTESETFAAASKAIDELVAVVRYVLNNLNGRHILITADHGFVFTESAPDATDKSKLDNKPTGTVMAKKRYLLGHDLPEPEQAWHGHTRDTARAEGGMEFWIPRGTNRFHFVGGARFVHGGAMLQEIVVPIITVKNMKDAGKREKTRSQPVSVQVLGNRHRVTTQRHRFRLLQTDAVSERIKPITLKIALYEGKTPVSTIETLTFDSPSQSMDERQTDVFLTLLDRAYDKKDAYHLILHDAETDIEHLRIDVTIDRAIADDFDF